MESKKKNKKAKILFIIVLVIVIIFASGFYYAYSRSLGSIKTDNITENKDELKIDSSVEKDTSHDIINVALFGIDTSAGDYDGSRRADSIMIATLDMEHKKIKLSSIMRDSYVMIPDYGLDKINHSYAYGGPELAIKTINQNFDMNITDYVTVNYSALEKIVDAVGGVQIDVKSEEISRVRGITEPGLQNLNGKQALAYSRIRYVGDGDYERTQRQRAVLETVITKVINNQSLPQAFALPEAWGLIENLSPYINTSFDKSQMVSLTTSVMFSGIKTTEDTRLPIDGHSVGGIWDSVYYLKYDSLSENVINLHEFIYEDQGYTPSAPVEEISNVIQATF